MIQVMNPDTKKLIEHFGGSRSRVATHFKVTRQTVSDWAKNGIPPAKALEVEEITFGKVKALDILRSYKSAQRVAA